MIFRFRLIAIVLALGLGGCLASNSQIAGPGAAPGNVLSAPAAGGDAPASDAGVDAPAAEPKPLPGGIASPTVDLEDDDGPTIATLSIRGTYATLCSAQTRSKIQIDGEVVAKWRNGSESCIPISKKLVSVVTSDGESHWATHALDEDCKFSSVIEAPAFGPRKFYLVHCDGFVCRPEDGQEPLASDFPTVTMAKTPPPCLSIIE